MKALTVITSGNDPQVPLMVRLFETCRIHEPLKTHGRFVVVTDRLSRSAVEALRSRSIDVVELGEEIDAEKSSLVSDKHAFGKLGKPVLLEAYLRRDPSANDTILYCDPDVVVVGPLDGILKGIPPNQIAMQQLLYPTHAWNHCVNQLKRGDGIAGRHIIPNGTEYCTGLIVAQRGPLLPLLRQWVDFQIDSPFNKLRNSDPGTQNAWHDQDFFRCLVRLHNPAHLRTIPFHHAPALNPPCERLFDITVDFDVAPPQVRCIHTYWLRPPLICHFAGGTYDTVPALKEYYRTAIPSDTEQISK